jgi:hypothetical protein
METNAPEKGDTTPTPAAAPAAAGPLLTVPGDTNTPENKRAFLAALAKAQGAYEEIEKNVHVKIVPRDATKRPYEFDYADLHEILTKTRKALSENGLSTRHRLIGHDGHAVWLVSILGHAEGYEDVSELQISTDVDDPKTFGGRVTFMRRYLLGPQLGIAGDGDLDDNGEGAGEGAGEGDPLGDVKRGAAVEPQKRTPARRSSAPAPGPRDSGPPPEPPPPEGFNQAAAPKPPAQQPAPPPGPVASANEEEVPNPLIDGAPKAVKQVDREDLPMHPLEGDNGELATDGEVAYIYNRIAKRNGVMRIELDALNLFKHHDDLPRLKGQLTKAEFEALKKRN